MVGGWAAVRMYAALPTRRLLRPVPSRSAVRMYAALPGRVVGCVCVGLCVWVCVGVCVCVCVCVCVVCVPQVGRVAAPRLRPPPRCPACRRIISKRCKKTRSPSTRQGAATSFSTSALKSRTPTPPSAARPASAASRSAPRKTRAADMCSQTGAARRVRGCGGL